MTPRRPTSLPLPGSALCRREFLLRTSNGIGAAALAGLLAPSGALAAGSHFPARARRVIYLFMSGAPSQLDLFDHKPVINARHGEELPSSVRGGQRVTLMTRDQKRFPVAGTHFKFARHGQSGQEFSELLPHTATVADEIAVLRAVHTEPINHDPAMNFILTGAGPAGRPTLGAWLSYGLGSENRDLPDFVVMLSGDGGSGQPLLSRYWHQGFLPSRHQGVQFRAQGDPVMYLSNPPGIDASLRGETLRSINELNALRAGVLHDPEIDARIDAYELAFRMQTSVPELVDLGSESAETLELYGATPGKPSFANNCLLARRLAERGVRFIQLYHRDWDHHYELPPKMRKLCGEVDRASAALVLDLKRRGMLEDTLVVWGGEFGRTTYCQGDMTAETYGRDHHPRCFSMWLAGGGIRGGLTWGETDDFGYNVVRDGVHVHDLQATILHQLGLDHTQLTYRFQGRDFRLTDIGGHVVQDLLA